MTSTSASPSKQKLMFLDKHRQLIIGALSCSSPGVHIALASCPGVGSLPATLQALYFLPQRRLFRGRISEHLRFVELSQLRNVSRPVSAAYPSRYTVRYTEVRGSGRESWRGIRNETGPVARLRCS